MEGRQRAAPSPSLAPSPPARDASRTHVRADKGMRIDYVLVERPLATRVQSATVCGRGAERAGFLGSDHCPLLVQLTPRDAAAAGDGKAAAAEATGGAGGGGSSA